MHLIVWLLLTPTWDCVHASLFVSTDVVVNLYFSPSGATIVEGTTRILSPFLCVLILGEIEIDIPLTVISMDGTANSKWWRI